jgi:FkbM family methyltransferase
MTITKTTNQKYEFYTRDEWESDVLVIKEAFDYNVYHLSRELFTGDKVFLDIGANIGAQSIFVSSIAPDARIIAFEPQPQNFELLKSNVELNKKNVEVDNRGVWHTPGKTKIHAGGGGSYIGEDGRDEIDLVTLPQIFEEYNLDQVSVLKVDIEHQNAEKLLLETPIALLKRCGYICVEFDGYTGSDETLLQKLVDYLSPYFDVEYNGNEKTGGDLWATKK